MPTPLFAALAQVAADAGDDASQQLSYVILGLVALAVVIAVATVVFWRLTAPDRRSGERTARRVEGGPGAPPTAG